MSYQNDSHKGGTNAKGLGNTKGSGTTKSGGSTKGGQHTSKGAHTAGSHGTPGAHGTGGAHGNSGRTFQAQDIKSLVHNQGRANLGGQEWALKAPSWNDAALQAIISDPKLTVKAAGKPSTDGKLTLELRGHGKTLNVTIGR